MIFYRFKQFYWSIKSLFIKDDLEILNRYLKESELELFMKITKSERYHSVRVCKSAIKYINSTSNLKIDKDKMCKCALLHDIGKFESKINIIHKGIIVIINAITFGNFLKYNNNRNIANYYNHPQIGAKLLENIKDIDLDIINCVRYHHNKDAIDENIYLDILTKCDNCN